MTLKKLSHYNMKGNSELENETPNKICSIKHWTRVIQNWISMAGEENYPEDPLDFIAVDRTIHPADDSLDKWNLIDIFNNKLESPYFIKYDKVKVTSNTIIPYNVTNGFLQGVNFHLKMCTGTSRKINEVNEKPVVYDLPCNTEKIYKKTDEYAPPVQRSFNFNIITTPNINTSTQKDLNLPLNTLEPYNNTSDIPDNILYLQFSSIQLIIEDDYGFDYLNFTHGSEYLDYFLFNLGQASIISFNPTIKDHFVSLMPQIQQIPMNLKPEPNEFRFTFIFPPHVLIFEEDEELAYNFTDLIADIGGFYSAISGIFYLLFGMQKHDPWGLVQKYLLSYIPFRQSFTRKFAEIYVTDFGLPFVEKIELKESQSSSQSADLTPPVENNPSSASPTTSGGSLSDGSQEVQPLLKDGIQIIEKLEFLKNRVQMLEFLLKDYYLDDYLLKKVRFTKRKYDERKNELSRV
ncbi:17951_t:CDS:2 [Funneliformis geosporum]|uniref:3894_t:CDS:1 n=1 Tax=Funneliformis geosporum TaxID=1117311 RepID=A0A9W4SG77_9GLOM|nr:17951_t:CDS:2 [Funneliformis geosporum]CAI2168400.1 3894_t:CDS:2 [Funneliformis geosporum]